VKRERGFSLVILMASITLMLILMSAAVPTWKYIMKDDREEELYFRGDQIARGIERYQRKNGNALPISLEVMVKGHYLRKAYKDPMVKDGQWRLIRPGEAVLPGPGQGGPSPSPGASPSPSPAVPRFPTQPRPGGGTQGAILGVASISKDKSLKIFNGRNRYDQWLFIAGQPRLLGRDQGQRPQQPGGGLPGAPGMPGTPGTMPTPIPRQPP
jgi:type II secretory pathway pseudopilin PulG